MKAKAKSPLGREKHEMYEHRRIGALDQAPVPRRLYPGCIIRYSFILSSVLRSTSALLRSCCSSLGHSSISKVPGSLGVQRLWVLRWLNLAVRSSLFAYCSAAGCGGCPTPWRGYFGNGQAHGESGPAFFLDRLGPDVFVRLNISLANADSKRMFF